MHPSRKYFHKIQFPSQNVGSRVCEIFYRKKYFKVVQRRTAVFFCKEFLDWNSSSASSSSSTMLVVIQNLILSQCWAVFKITWKFLKIKLFSFIKFHNFTTNYDLAHATRHGIASMALKKWKNSRVFYLFIFSENILIKFSSFMRHLERESKIPMGGINSVWIKKSLFYKEDQMKILFWCFFIFKFKTILISEIFDMKNVCAHSSDCSQILKNSFGFFYASMTSTFLYGIKFH